MQADTRMMRTSLSSFTKSNKLFANSDLDCNDKKLIESQKMQELLNIIDNIRSNIFLIRERENDDGVIAYRKGITDSLYNFELKWNEMKILFKSDESPKNNINGSLNSLDNEPKVYSNEFESSITSFVSNKVSVGIQKSTQGIYELDKLGKSNEFAVSDDEDCDFLNAPACTSIKQTLELVQELSNVLEHKKLKRIL